MEEERKAILKTYQDEGNFTYKLYLISKVVPDNFTDYTYSNVITIKLWKMLFLSLPIASFLVFLIDYFLSNLLIALAVGFVCWCFLFLFYCCFLLHKFLRISILHTEKLRLESILEKNCLSLKEKTCQYRL